MPRNIVAAAAAISLICSPAAAADLGIADDPGARRSGAGAGVYFAVPLSGERGGRPQAGLRLTMTHDYRSSQAPGARVLNSDAVEFRFLGDEEPTFYVAGMAVTGEEGRRNRIAGPASGIITIGILVATVVGGYVIYKAIDDNDDDADNN